jgi:putative GTP pyrophosphokinase
MRDQLRDSYEDRLDLLEGLRKSLELETKRALAGIEHIDRISFRVKSPQSFVAKATDPRNEPPYEDPLVEIEDQVAGRIIVFFLEDLGIVRERLRGTFTAVEFEQRRPPADAEFGYESNHLVCIVPPQVKPDGWEEREDLPPTFELQIRTIFMHAYAEPQHDIAYKSAIELSGDVRRELAWIAASAWGADRAYSRVRDWYTENEN